VLAAVLSLVPAVAAFLTVSAQLDLGLSAPWHLLLMIEGGQIGFGMCLLWCALIGGLIACVSAAAAARGRPRIDAPSLTGPGEYAGPGSLGATPSALKGR
jgi:hypothetical protein